MIGTYINNIEGGDDQNGTVIGKENQWNPANLSPYAFTYMLPFKDDHAFLVVACVDIRCPAMMAPVYRWTYGSSTSKTYQYNQTLNPDTGVEHGTYYGINNSWAEKGNYIFTTDAFDASSKDVVLSAHGLQCFADIHIYSVKHGEVVRITPPAKVIENLRQYMHPDPLAFNNYTVSVDAEFGGQYSRASTARQVSYGPYGYGIEDFSKYDETIGAEYSRKGGGTHKITIPNMAAYNAHVENVMPLWDAYNEERCLNFQYGVGSILTNSHSELKSNHRTSYKWGGFDTTSSRARLTRAGDYVPIPKNQEWFRYFSPAIYSTINNQTAKTFYYRQFENTLPVGAITLTGKNNSKFKVEYPPKFIVNADREGTIMITDPAKWPESLPVSTTTYTQPSKLIESGSVAYKNAELCTHLAYNWSNAWYCWDELIKLGFTTRELGPRPQSHFPEVDFGQLVEEEEDGDESA